MHATIHRYIGSASYTLYIYRHRLSHPNHNPFINSQSDRDSHSNAEAYKNVYTRTITQAHGNAEACPYFIL